MESYYRQQAGGTLPVYSMQSGRGLFGSLFRLAMPLLKTGVKKALPHAVRAGKRVFRDAVKGRNIGKAIKRRAIQAATDAILPANERTITKKKNKATRPIRRLVRSRLKRPRKLLRNEAF